jgi:hypothetical protein
MVLRVHLFIFWHRSSEIEGIWDMRLSSRELGVEPRTRKKWS